MGAITGSLALSVENDQSVVRTVQDASARARDEDRVRGPHTHRRHFDVGRFELEHFTKLERRPIAGSKLGPLTRREPYALSHMLSFDLGQTVRPERLRCSIEHVP